LTDPRAGDHDSTGGETAAGTPEGPPRARRDDVLRWGAALHGMARLRSLLTHDLRSRVQGLSLQADLVAELGRSGVGVPDESRARLARYAKALHAEILDLYEASESTLRLLQVDEAPSREPENPTVLLRDLDRVLTPLARQRRVRLALVGPADPLETAAPVAAAPVALRHATLLLLIEAIVRCPAEQELRYTVAPIDGDLACTLEGPAELTHLLEHELAAAPEPGTAADLGNGFTAVRSAVQSGAAQIAAVGPGRLVMRWPLAR